MSADHSTLGHLYVLEGDLQQIAVDAWLLPSDGWFNITDSWEITSPHLSGVDALRDEGWNGRKCVFLDTVDGADVWIGDVGRQDFPSSHYVDRAVAFIEAASEKSRDRAAAEGRLPIVGINHLGTGKGGAFRRHGEVLSDLVNSLTEMLNRGDLKADVVLVAWGEQPESASQYLRSTRVSRWQDDPQWDFGSQTTFLHSIAEDLAAQARHGRLSVFLGAGTSIGAGLPGWKALLDGVARAGGVLDNEETLDGLEDLRDKASLIDSRLRKKGFSLHELLKESLSHSKYSLQHGLLSSLPCNEFITTNVDELFEQSCRTGNRPLTVMPHQEGDNSRWLLKLHGTVSEPAGMVFTRENYLDAGRSSRALMGLVQAMLFTRHMLFVGYGLSDEDFHELVYEVKRAFGPNQVKGPIGTVLLLRDEPLKSEIWEDILRIVPIGTSMDDAQNARDVARFIDLVGMLSADKSMFFLDRRYAHPTTNSEVALDKALRTLSTSVTDKETPVWAEVSKLLYRLGWNPNQDKQ